MWYQYQVCAEFTARIYCVICCIGFLQLGAAFVATARNSSHRGRSVVDEDAVLIYNWPAQFYGRHTSVDDELPFEQASGINGFA